MLRSFAIAVERGEAGGERGEFQTALAAVAKDREEVARGFGQRIVCENRERIDNGLFGFEVVHGRRGLKATRQFKVRLKKSKSSEKSWPPTSIGSSASPS